MKLAVMVGSTTMIFPAESAGILVPAFAETKVYEKPWYAEKEWKAKDEKVEFQFIEESVLGATPEPIAKLAKEIEDKTTYWMNELRAHGETKKKLEDAEKRIAEFEALAGKTTEAA